jgi:metal-responsive CopG/Arc/MetJ family transcriptional regulator
MSEPVTIQVALSDENLAHVDRLAEATGRTRDEMIDELVRTGLHEAEERAARGRGAEGAP